MEDTLSGKTIDIDSSCVCELDFWQVLFRV